MALQLQVSSIFENSHPQIQPTMDCVVFSIEKNQQVSGPMKFKAMLFKGQLYNELVNISVFLSYVSHSGQLQLWELLMCCQVRQKRGQPEDPLLAVGVWQGAVLRDWALDLWVWWQSQVVSVRTESGTRGAWGVGGGCGVRGIQCAARKRVSLLNTVCFVGSVSASNNKTVPLSLPPCTYRWWPSFHAHLSHVI